MHIYIYMYMAGGCRASKTSKGGGGEVVAFPYGSGPGGKQAAGRAGRAGLDEAGESFLIAPERDAEAVFRLMQGRMPAISSCLARRWLARE